jgi:macrolide-specific efflux system membrane fusion protein
MRRSWLAIALLIGACGAATGFLVLRARDDKASAAGVTVVYPEVRTIRSLVSATGTVRLRVGSEVRVGSQLSGIVKKLYVTVGSHVRSGAVIAEIDDRTIRARLADAEAQAELDRAGLDRARVDYERTERLATQGLVPVQQKQDLELAFQEAKARYGKALRARDLVAVDLGYVSIRVPISGTVASVSTQEGETVAASFTAPTFVTIIADHALQLVGMVDETDIARVRPGNPVTFTVDAYPSRDFLGLVESIAPKATIVSGVVNYEVTIRIKDAVQLLKPDMTANLSIETSQAEALLLPSTAVQRDADGPFVSLAKRQGERRRIVVGGKEKGMIEIKKGLLAGDGVVVPAVSAEPAIETK